MCLVPIFFLSTRKHIAYSQNFERNKWTCFIQSLLNIRFVNIKISGKPLSKNHSYSDFPQFSCQTSNSQQAPRYEHPNVSLFRGRVNKSLWLGISRLSTWKTILIPLTNICELMTLFLPKKNITNIKEKLLWGLCSINSNGKKYFTKLPCGPTSLSNAHRPEQPIEVDTLENIGIYHMAQCFQSLFGQSAWKVPRMLTIYIVW